MNSESETRWLQAWQVIARSPLKRVESIASSAVRRANSMGEVQALTRSKASSALVRSASKPCRSISFSAARQQAWPSW